MADILVVAAHPDDAELNVGGTILRHVDAGRSVAICDLTRGERGSRGSADLRAAETMRANRALGIADDMRWNLGIPDGDIRATPETTLSLVRAIRHFRPTVLLLPWDHDRHPDHEDANRLARRACFDAGLTHVESTHDGRTQSPHRPERMYCFMQAYEREPDFVVDISDQFDRKLDAIAAYASQFTVPGRSVPEDEGGPETFISRAEFMEAFIARMRHWGFMIGRTYGEAFCTVNGPVELTQLV